MTSWRIERLDFDSGSVDEWSRVDPRHSNWPVVYSINGPRSIYVGETGNAMGRMRQHLGTKDGLDTVRVVIDETFNKSVCLDLESTLIRLLGGDGKFEVLNRNDGITDAEYFDRAWYRLRFDEIFDELRAAGYFDRSIPEIVNSDLFKLSPFKALTHDQAIVVESILDGLFEDLAADLSSASLVEGHPGTGKTILA
ncbi:DUF2075 domain-containing protein, partial [Georgenia sp. Z1491]